MGSVCVYSSSNFPIAIIALFSVVNADFKYTEVCGGDGLKELCNEVSLYLHTHSHLILHALYIYIHTVGNSRGLV